MKVVPFVRGRNSCSMGRTRSPNLRAKKEDWPMGPSYNITSGDSPESQPLCATTPFSDTGSDCHSTTPDDLSRSSSSVDLLSPPFDLLSTPSDNFTDFRATTPKEASVPGGVGPTLGSVSNEDYTTVFLENQSPSECQTRASTDSWTACSPRDPSMRPEAPGHLFRSVHPPTRERRGRAPRKRGLPPATPLSLSTVVVAYTCRLLIALVVFLVSLLGQGMATIWSDQYYKTGEKRLSDRVHDWLGGHPPRWAAASLVNTCCAFMIMATVVRTTVFVDWQTRFAIWTRFFWILSTLYWIRCFCFLVTTLPCPVETCVPLRPTSFRQMMNYTALEIVGGVYECTDLVISGHTLCIVSMAMIWVFYHGGPTWLIWVSCGYALWCLVLLNISFFHYTVDIAMGTFFSVGGWTVYHLLLDLAVQRYTLTGRFTFKGKVKDGRRIDDRRYIVDADSNLVPNRLGRCYQTGTERNGFSARSLRKGMLEFDDGPDDVCIAETLVSARSVEFHSVVAKGRPSIETAAEPRGTEAVNQRARGCQAEPTEACHAGCRIMSCLCCIDGVAARMEKRIQSLRGYSAHIRYGDTEAEDETRLVSCVSHEEGQRGTSSQSTGAAAFSGRFRLLGDWLIAAIVFMEALDVRLRYAEETATRHLDIGGQKPTLTEDECKAGFPESREYDVLAAQGTRSQQPNADDVMLTTPVSSSRQLQAEHSVPCSPLTSAFLSQCCPHGISITSKQQWLFESCAGDGHFDTTALHRLWRIATFGRLRIGG